MSNMLSLPLMDSLLVRPAHTTTTHSEAVSVSRPLLYGYCRMFRCSTYEEARPFLWQHPLARGASYGKALMLARG